MENLYFVLVSTPGLFASIIRQATGIEYCHVALAFDPDILLTSARTGQGLPELLAALDKALGDRVRPVKLLLPYNKLGLADNLRARGSVTAEEYRDTGLYLEGMCPTEELHRYEPYLLN